MADEQAANPLTTPTLNNGDLSHLCRVAGWGENEGCDQRLALEGAEMDFVGFVRQIGRFKRETQGAAQNLPSEFDSNFVVGRTKLVRAEDDHLSSLGIRTSIAAARHVPPARR